MPDLSFKEFKELCEANLDKKYVAECLDIIQNDECIYHDGFSMPHDHITRIYETRLEIAKEQTNIILRKTYIQDFENCVSNLKITQSKEIGIAALNIDNCEYLVFYEPVNMMILGILKVEVPWTLDELNKKFSVAIKEGRSSFASEYSKGKFVRDWK